MRVRKISPFSKEEDIVELVRFLTVVGLVEDFDDEIDIGDSNSWHNALDFCENAQSMGKDLFVLNLDDFAGRNFGPEVKIWYCRSSVELLERWRSAALESSGLLGAPLTLP